MPGEELEPLLKDFERFSRGEPVPETSSPSYSDDRTNDGEPYVYEQRTKVKVWRNAKNEPQWQVEVIEHCDPDELQRLTELAVAQYQYLQSLLA